MLPKNKGKIEEYKILLSQKAKGNKNSLGVKRSKEWIENLKKRVTGRKHTKETIQKIKQNRAGKCCGNNNGSWKGGITPINKKIRHSLEYKLWRKAVFERDNYTCIWCGARSCKGKDVILQADHIKPFAYYPEVRFAIDNGRTLCMECHKKTDTYGFKVWQI